MPRQGGINIAVGINHVIQQGIEHRKIFRENTDREKFIRRLAEGLKEMEH